ncbi:hypothetical protein Cabys_521 [Caldithrix abyssi DSM 13497]|uniref:Uncharacterized protein n=1 Tax=Caldithrix abyssi DSM 13497 TaxID=880073 RepID=A0A1J1C5V8_CALAY|nr:hypothetical protein Cabys_521 [Caldithrix abyssi DSM 13497]
MGFSVTNFISDFMFRISGSWGYFFEFISFTKFYYSDYFKIALTFWR